MSVYNFANSVVAGSAGAAGAAGQSTGFYPKTIDQSLRFNDDDSAYLIRTPASAGNRKTWTWSAWVKRSDLGNGDYMLGSGGVSGQRGSVRFNSSSDTLLIFFGDTGNDIYLVSSAVYRDTSSWYHIVISVDTTQSTSSDRVKIYVNGEQITDFSSSTYPAQNWDSPVNNTVAQYLGAQNGGSGYFDGYMSEIHFTDGTAYDADAFGEFKNGVWVAKTPSVTYGTNGFYLDFADGAAIGDDESGNGNDWTPNNLAASDVVADSPTNNFATFNPLQNGCTLSEGNLKFTSSTGAGKSTGTIAVSEGKWYWEVYVVSNDSGGVGIANFDSGTITTTNSLGEDSGTLGWIWREPSSSYSLTRINGSTVSYASLPSDGDVIGVALDLDAGTLTCYLNNTSQGNVTTGLSGTYAPAISDDSTFGQPTLISNFGQDSTFAGNKTAQGNTDDNGIGDFYYTPPTGYLALSTANLPDPAIDPAQGSSPEDYFNTVLYTGDGTSSRAITGVGFEPDFVWIKERTSTSFHVLHDVIRGPNNILYSNTTDAQQTGFTNGLLSFDTDGFTVGDSGAYNQSSQDFVGWNWKAGGTGVSNTDGAITSTVSANTESGFSIITYTGNGTNGATVGHGLDSAPDLWITKNRSSGTADWLIKTSDMASNEWLRFTNGALLTNLTNNTADSTVITTGGDTVDNINGQNFVTYAFHNVEGFSKVGTFTGNGSADGPFVYTGFRPTMIIVKNQSQTDNWFILDDKRDDQSIINSYLMPNQSTAEDANNSTVDTDFVANGFKLRATSSAMNGSTNTMLYIAFAENPFKYSNAR